MNKAQKEKLTQKYMTNKIPLLTNYQKEWIRKETAHYIFVDRDENGKHKCFCDSCGKEVDLGKTKHLETVKCPECGKEMTVIHKWRKKVENIETVDWIVIPHVLDGNTLMLRYVYAHRVGEECYISEAARVVFDTRQKTQHFFCFWTDGWKYTKQTYFIEHNMSYYLREWCCLQAKEYRPTWKRELKKLNCFKYWPEDIGKANNFYYLNDGLKFYGYKAPLYEKLLKVGLNDIVKEDERGDLGHNFGIEYNTKETSLVKMLGINKMALKKLLEHPSVCYLQTLQAFNGNLDEETMELIGKTHAYNDELNRMKKEKLNIKKTLRYCGKKNVTAGEYLNYYRMLKELNYPLDNAYLFPADLHKDERRLMNELLELRNRMREEEAAKLYQKELEKAKKNDASIKEISDALKNNAELREFFRGCDGLQVVVPESAEDLYEEGKELHNCLRTYVDRYAKGKTLIFFVRRLDDPTAPFVAMEYCHGKIIQCRYDYNRAVDDEKVIGLANRLAETLAKENILVA